MATDVAPVTVYNVEFFRPIAPHFYVEKNYTPRVVLTYDTAVLEAIQALRADLDNMKEQLSYLVANSTGQPVLVAQPSLENQSSDDQLLIAIKDLFVSAGDETLYPSDVARHLGLSYEKVVELIEELEKDGQIVGT